MDDAIKYHFGQTIAELIPLTGGYTFQTTLLVLSGGRKVVVRASQDFVTGGGRQIIIADTFGREKYFYDAVNRSVGHICPEVYVIDGSCGLYHMPYQISEYLEGTPLNQIYDKLNEQQKSEVSYRFGEMAAKIGKLEIDLQHQYVAARGTWEEFFAGRLRERLTALVKNDAVTPEEVDLLTTLALSQKAENTLSFIHLDMQYINIILNNGSLYLIDAENCEFGDPLFELTVIDINGTLNDSFMRGYENAAGFRPNLDCELYCLYKLERLALITDVFLNEVKTDTHSAKKFHSAFMELKGKLL